MKTPSRELSQKRADDFAVRENGVTIKELDRFVRAANRQIGRERESGKIKAYSSDLEADLTS